MISIRRAITKAGRAAPLLALSGLMACFSGGNDSSTTPDLPELSVFDAPGVDQTFADAFWAELAQDYEAFVPEPTLGAAQAPEDFINEGRWGPLIEWPEIATGAANIPDGRIITWSATGTENFGGKKTFTHSSVFDPTTELFSDSDNPVHNNFCAGIAMLPDGRPFAAGGGATVTTTSVYDSATNTWSLIDDMAFPRWYATSTTLPSGQVLTNLGTNKQPHPEIWTETEGWKAVNNLSLQSVLNDDSAKTSQRFWFPAMNVTPGGTLFHPGPTSQMFSLDLDAADGFIPHGRRETGDPFRLYNTTVMYDVGKMLVAGGGQPALSSAMTIDLNAPSPVVASTDPMHYPRSMQNSVVLPNGEVLVIGGNSSGVQFSDDGTQLVPEMWNPESGQWQTLAPHAVPRNYHSTALLLKDARVASMGGGLCGDCKTNHRSGQIFEPPYLFNADGTAAARPDISGNDLIASVGDTITIDGSAGIDRFTMVRLVALSHHHTTDQRLIPLNFQPTANNSYQLEIPSNPNVVIPGFYWIFALDAQGVPSQGRTIQISVSEPVKEFKLPNEDSVTFEYYQGNWNELPDFDRLELVSTGKLDNFILTPRQQETHFGFRYTAKLRVPRTGVYTFYTTSDDGSKLYINGQEVVDNDGLHAAEEENGTAQLEEGEHDIEVAFFERTGSQTLLVQWAGPGFGKQNIATGLIGTGSEVPAGEPLDPEPGDAPVDPADPTESNFIANSTFEDTANDWAACSADATVELTEDSFAGNYALTVAGCAYDEFPVVEGNRYRLQCAAQSDGSAFTSLTLSISDASYNELATQSVEVTQIDYANFTAELVAPADSAFGAVTLYSGTDGAQFDNCSVQIVTDDTPPVTPPVNPPDSPVTPVTPIDPTDGNLITNATFEQGVNDWAVCSDGATLDLSNDSFSGSGALSVTGCAYDEFPVIAGQFYTLTCAAKAGTARFSSLSLALSRSDYTQLESESTVISQAGYNTYTVELLAPAESSLGVVTLYGEAGNVIYDDCEVTASNTDTGTTPDTTPDTTTDTTPDNPSPLPAGSNLLANPDFENGLSDWTSCQTGSSLESSPDAASGNAAFALNGCAFTEFSVTPGSTYQLSCSARGNNTDFANLTLSYNDSAFNTLASADQIVASGDTYSTVTIESVAPAGSSSGVVDLFAEGGESALFDDCEVIELSAGQ